MRHEHEPRLVDEEAGLFDGCNEILAELPQRAPPQRICFARAVPLERPAREFDQPGEVAPAHAEVHSGHGIGSHDERQRSRVAHEVFDKGLVRSEAPRHVAPRRRLGRDERRVLRRPLSHLEQQLGVCILGTPECLPAHRPCGRRRRAAERILADRRAVHVARQLRDATAEILLARDELSRRAGECFDAPPFEQLEHLTRAQSLTRLEGGGRPPTRLFQQGELRVHVPLVGEELRPPLGECKRPAGTIDFSERRPQLASSAVEIALLPPRECEPRMQAPDDLRRHPSGDLRERRSVQGFSDYRRSLLRFELRPRGQCGSGGDRITEARQVGGGAVQLVPRRRVAALTRQLAQRQPRERRGALVPRGRLRAQRGLEQRPGARGVIAFQE